jgi:hypothetical protein
MCCKTSRNRPPPHTHTPWRVEAQVRRHHSWQRAAHCVHPTIHLTHHLRGPDSTATGAVWLVMYTLA